MATIDNAKRTVSSGGKREVKTLMTADSDISERSLSPSYGIRRRLERMNWILKLRRVPCGGESFASLSWRSSGHNIRSRSLKGNSTFRSCTPKINLRAAF
jgi:hypothetical protein